ncbi:Gamma-glutamyl-GABA hydrolase [Pseudomonas savastanoi pv. glycinea]|nr:Gamma-glutamyl-GABA hydrolase [Pseudomonas savastanoi pv. glycinea]RMT08750.1 Glutamine amidotransferase [Pseudomonas savastanoi pv. phaseolicola]RMN09869.1 Gamma-glutamyl-GABA hydrolase [Pseudomonas savastanoi pv. glycinea]RMO30690.1 Gamma-glutamyl-GABA hydrolase [Pseudomonas savastanoi pv. glycinea]RMU57216.1 Gamma-glutamyl-GABA hydrolase [Pseudomonas savastanoi pv. glycinea]
MERNTVEISTCSKSAARARVRPRTSASTRERSAWVISYCIAALFLCLNAYVCCADEYPRLVLSRLDSVILACWLTRFTRTQRMSRPPLIGVTACRQQLGKYSSHTAGDKYVEAAAFAGVPVILPALDVPTEPAQLLASLDGLLFTGSPSNVEPHHYNGPASVEGTAHDVFRDRTTLPLLRAAIAQGVPVLCICRGFQELNVALGGSLHQRVQELPGYLDHREPQSDVLAVQYATQHPVQVRSGGVLEALGLTPGFEVNSLHSQGIDRLASDLRAEALAPDGLVEAVSLPGAPGFVLGVQWHPEWEFMNNPVSLNLFTAFREACLAYARNRQGR